MSKFAPKEPVQLDTPRDDIYTKEQLARFNGMVHVSFESITNSNRC